MGNDMARQILTAFMVVVCPFFLCGQSGPADDPGLKISVRSVSKEGFTIDNIAGAAMVAARGRSGPQVIWFFSSPQDRVQMLSWVSSVEGRTYEQWTREHSRLASRRWNVARCVSWGGSAVLEVRDSSDAVNRRVLFGENPLAVGPRGEDAEILDITMTRSDDVTIIGRARNLNLGTVNEIWEHFHKVLAKRVTILLMLEPWFVYEPSVRAFMPFAKSARIPTEAEAAGLPELSCSGFPLTDARPRCACQVGDSVRNDLTACFR